MKLIVGLGNPSPEYARTRHNLGRRVIEAFGGNDWQTKGKLFAEIIELTIDGKKAVVARPLTFMNESGRAVGALSRFYKIKGDELLVVHDDSDIFFGKMKLSYGSRSAGHRGVESIIRAMKSKNFWRLRIGIRPANEEIRKKADELILEPFTNFEEKKLDEIIAHARELIRAWINK